MLGEIPSDDPFFSQEQIRTLRTRFENREVLEVSHPKNQLPYRRESKLVTPKMDG